MIEEWVVTNLSLYGNCLIPDKYIETLGIEKLSEELTKLCGRETEVLKRICLHEAGFKKRKKKEILYIAQLI